MRRTAFTLSFVLLLSQRAALAEQGEPRTPSTSEAPAHFEPSWTRRQTAGVVVMLATLAAGVALTSYGLTIDCGEEDVACQRRASAPIWGGVGVAAVGSLVGLRLLQPPSSLPARSSVAVITLRGSF